MDVASVIGILLFILPGIIAQKASRIMGFPRESKNGDFNELVYSITLSFPILFFILGIVHIIYGLKSLQEYVNKLNDVGFLLLFITITLVASILLGFLSAPIKNRTMNWINKRRNNKKKISIDDKTCWEKTFLTDYNSKYLKVFQDGNIVAQGFSKHYSLPDEGRSLTLYIPEELTKYPDFMPDDLFIHVAKTYIDLEKNIVINDYDMKQFNSWCDEKEETPISSEAVSES